MTSRKRIKDTDDYLKSIAISLKRQEIQEVRNRLGKAESHLEATANFDLEQRLLEELSELES